jgi:beta-lactamase superfamily II metal-dependent hydrolase
MSNGKGGKKKIITTIVTVIIVLVASFFGLDVSEILETNNPVQTETVTQTPQLEAPSSIEGELIVTMIDVGQADSFLFQQNDKTMLVDCGTRSSGDDVVKYIKGLGITRLDYVFGTHPHDDHMGGMYDVITNVEVGKIIIPDVEDGRVTSNWYEKLIKEIAEGGYDLEYAKLGNEYNLGDAKVKIIGQLTEYRSDLNNYSTVMKVSFGEMDIIMTGDAEIIVEEEILKSGVNLDAEILKVGHHGSRTSSGKAFIDAINPKYSIISVGKNNRYGHPNKEVLENLKNQKYIELIKVQYYI